MKLHAYAAELREKLQKVEMHFGVRLREMSPVPLDEILKAVCHSH